MPLDKRLDPKDRLGQRVDEMMSMSKSRRRKYEQRWYDNNFFDDGYHFRYVSRTTGKILDMSSMAGNDSPIRAIPKASRQIRGLANLIMGTDPVPVVYPDVARGMSAEMIESRKKWAKNTGLWLENEWKDQDLKGKLTEMLILSMKHGVSYLQVWPDFVEEKINTKVYDAFDIYLDGSQTNIQDCPFVIKAIPMLVSKIKANEMFDKEQKTKISPDWKYASSEIKDAYMITRYGKSQNDDNSATVILKEAFIKTYLNEQNMGFIGSKYPDAIRGKEAGDVIMRHVFVAGNVWLFDEYLPEDEYPFVALTMEPGPLYQTPQIERFIPANKSLDLVMSRVEKFVNTMTTGIWLKRKGESFKPTNIPGGQVIEYGGQPPTQADMTPLPNHVFNFIELLEKFIEEQGASVSSLAQLPPGVRSGVAIESLKSTEYANLKINTDQAKQVVELIAQTMVRIAADHYITPQTIKRLENGEPRYFDIIGEVGVEARKVIGETVPEDIAVISREAKVDIEVSTDAAFTMEGKREIAQQITSFFIELAKVGLVNQSQVDVLVKALIETYKFGNTQEFLEALDEPAQPVAQGGGSQESLKDEMKLAVLETLVEAGLINPQQSVQNMPNVQPQGGA